VSVANKCGLIKLTPWEGGATLQKFWLVPLTFMISIFCNIKILSYTNVGTFIALRSSTPLVLAILDKKFAGRTTPPRQAWVSIVGVLLSSMLYIQIEGASVSTDSFSWIIIWYATFCFDQMYTKHVVDTVVMTTWDRVWYTNTVPLVILFPLIFIVEDDIVINSDELRDTGGVVVASCVGGLMMSTTSYWLRGEVSATTFAVVGNACKFITVLLNYVMWDKHASRRGVGALMMGIAFSMLYRPNKLIDKKKANSV